jgi:NAD(P)-dependent dehydrogenase (short-subunit alcohol dehydrogenase family)
VNINGLFDLSDRVAIVTGSSSGLGVIFAETLIEAGAKVVLAARRKDLLYQVAKKLNSQSHENAVVIPTDVTKEEQVSKLISDTVEQLGRLDILVNNAGIAKVSYATETSLEDWQHVLDVNLTGAFLCSREAAKIMMKSGGSIINISSVLGLIGSRLKVPGYYAAKGGLASLTRSLAVEWARYNIRVNAIAPGFFPSEMTKDVLANPKLEQALLLRTPMRRIGKLEELNGPLLLLASDASSFITGQVIVVDGGYTAY